MHLISPARRHTSRHARRLIRDARGVAMIEFAFSMPLLLLLACYGIEFSNYAVTQLRVSQLALALADNASRVGMSSNLATVQLRELDMNDVLQGTRIQGQQLGIVRNGRIIVSSLEADDKDVQRIHWQRCLGLKSGTGYDSSYGTTSIDAGTAPGPAYAGTIVAGGMGDPGAKVIAPTSSGVMFVEVNYLYQPLFGTWLLGQKRIHYIASFIVRDRRDFKQIYNLAPKAQASTCDRYTT